MLAGFIGIFCTFSGALLGFAFAGRRKRDSRASSLGKANRNDLLRGSCAVLATANFVDLGADKLSCLCRRRFARPLGLASLRA